MRKIAVIGAGQMGTGIAQTVAANGMTVLLSDVDLAQAQAGKANVEKALVKLMGRGKIEAGDAFAEKVLATGTGTTQTPATMGFEGSISYSDVTDARAL